MPLSSLQTTQINKKKRQRGKYEVFMKKGDIVECEAHKINFPNKCICKTDEGEDVIVKNAIPGQRLSVMISKKRSGKAEGRIVEVIKPADGELVPPKCEHFGICGGCAYQCLPYDKQLDIKSGQIRDLMTPVLGEKLFDDIFEGVKSSPKQFEYRNKMEFSFGDEFKGGPLSLGMHKKGSFYDIVPVEKCAIVSEEFRQILSVTRKYFDDNKTPFFHKDHTGYLRHLLVRRAEKTGEILVDLVTSTQAKELEIDEFTLLQGWVDELLKVVKPAGILHTLNDAFADVVEDHGTTVLYGQSFFTENLLGLNFKITPFSFFQTNTLGAELLYETAREFISTGADGAEVYDLYSGTGTIAQVISPAAKHVTGVEIVAEAVEAAKENAALNGLNNCDFIAGDVLKVLDDITEKPDYIILDPPRDGIHPKALTKIIDYGVDSLVYISCKPTSLVRDLAVFMEHDYMPTRMVCVDMFPGTVHVETVVLLTRS